jgi:hypothetical protein
MIDLDKLSRALAEQRFTDSDLAFRDLMQILNAHSHLPVSHSVYSTHRGVADEAVLYSTLANMIADLFAVPESQISVPDYDALMSWQITLSQIFNLAHFHGTANADSVIETILAHSKGQLSGSSAIKLSLLFGTESALAERLQPLLLQNPELFLNTCMMHVWGCSGSAQSCANREWAYAQIPQLFAALDNPNYPVLKIHGYFMHSSYGFASNKHALKASLNFILQKKIQATPLLPCAAEVNPHSTKAHLYKQASGKKVILVMLEMFNEVHSVYRVLGKSLRVLKQNYTLIAVAWPGYVHVPDGFFDEILTLSAMGDNFCAQELVDIASAYKPVAVYFPSIGMTPWAIYHSNMRLAPVQFTAIGHGASSFATEIDYFLIESDIAGDIHTYSEKVIALKPGHMPFYPPNNIKYPKLRGTSQQNEVVNIVCSASSVKLNYKLLEICRNTVEKYKHSTQKIAFHFFGISHGTSMSAQTYKKLILSYLPDATIHFAKDFQSYVNELSHMHISVSTFPFAGMNTIIDFAMSGIPGVRMDGPEVHEAFDPGMWRRMGMPEWAIAKDEQTYEAALCRMIDNPGLRQTMSHQLQKEERWQVFFKGDAMQFVMAVHEMIAKHGRSASPNTA